MHTTNFVTFEPKERACLFLFFHFYEIIVAEVIGAASTTPATYSYGLDPMISDRQVWANSVDPHHTAPEGVLTVWSGLHCLQLSDQAYTILQFRAVCIFWRSFSMVKQRVHRNTRTHQNTGTHWYLPEHTINDFWFDFCFTALQHILGHFECGQLP